MTYTLPPYFILKRYRPNITDNYPELELYKNISVLISVNKVSSDVWSLSLVEHPEIILDKTELIETSNDKWFNNKIQSFSVFANNKINNILITFNNYIINHSSGYIPLFKISDPCCTLSEEFVNLNQYKSFQFELKMKNSPKNKNNNSYIQELINKNELCPVTMVPLTKDSIRLTSCGHAISKDVEKWIVDKKTCPMCRAPQTLDKLSKWVYT
jgi:hypothetical protein